MKVENSFFLFYHEFFQFFDLSNLYPDPDRKSQSPLSLVPSPVYVKMGRKVESVENTASNLCRQDLGCFPPKYSCQLEETKPFCHPFMFVKPSKLTTIEKLSSFLWYLLGPSPYQHMVVILNSNICGRIGKAMMLS